MDPFAIVVLVVLTALVLWVWMLGRANSGRSVEQFGLRSARRIEQDREALEREDLEQLLDAHNARRRRRGEAEVTVAQVEAQVAQEATQARERLLAERDLDQLLAATNARRRARGQPERTRQEVIDRFGAGGG
ncbi:MAG: hypothetical protein ACRDMX_00620 [Solirubrobacteraceae bacterium]